MKNLIKLIIFLACLTPAYVWGQSSAFIRNDGASTTLVGTNLDPGAAAISSKGELFCTAGTASASLGKAEDAAHTSGDTGVMSLGVANTGFTALAANGDYTPLATNLAGAQYVDINFSAQSSANGANALLKLEDSAHSSGDAGVMSLGVTNESFTNKAGADDDYAGIAVTRKGAPMVVPVFDGNIVGGTQLVKVEDAAVASGDAGVAALTQRLDQLATGQTGSNNEYAVPIVDTLSRLYVNPWGAAVTEHFQACSGSITTTTQTDIKAAVVGNRIYVTSIGCNNTANVASTLVFGDGASAVWQGAISNSTLQGVAGYTMTFPTPLRGTINTAFTVTLGTTATATRCCASGFISPY